MSVSEATRREACDRDGIFNPDGYDPQHCFFKSEYYGKDKNDPWNIAPIRRNIHDCLHHPGTDEQARIGQKAEIEFKEKALERYKEINPNNEKTIAMFEQIIKRKKLRYGIQ